MSDQPLPVTVSLTPQSESKDTSQAATSVETGANRVRCPHCHNPIQLRDDGGDEALCPGCGSSFRLRDTRQTTTGAEMRPLMREEPRPPRRVKDKIPRDLETICLHAMAKDPSRRYRSAAEMAEDLGRWLSGRPISGRRGRQTSRYICSWRKSFHLDAK